MVKTAPKQPDLNTLSFENAIAELEGIITALERGDIGLEESITCYTRGMALKTHCEKKLQEAKLKVEAVSTSASGDIKTAPFDTE